MNQKPHPGGQNTTQSLILKHCMPHLPQLRSMLIFQPEERDRKIRDFPGEHGELSVRTPWLNQMNRKAHYTFPQMMKDMHSVPSGIRLTAFQKENITWMFLGGFASSGPG